ncbi:phage portal protein [Massilia sp. CCM 8733]|uniref:Phage portal protein n=1 Tax=Massilia mucilaginosa TaxID=2609282 RepID=A0ABX0P532_9BURK|nr:phage portal protein [Massilia mucilaginosa]NHZ93537.1 phage portal protein [Massilia mucilaginosa]
MSLFNSFRGWLGRGGAIAETQGTQAGLPGAALTLDTTSMGVDGALQISTVWACIDRRATLVASLPFFAYEQVDGEKVLARKSRLYELLHESPNSRMTPFEFWRAMMMNHDLRGNAYARIDRDGAGEAVALWPMPADQVESEVLQNGSMIYKYRIGNDVAVFSDRNVLHLKNLGNGTTGLSKLEFMRATLDEGAKSQAAASKLFANGGKPSGILMIDKVLDKAQRAAVKKNFEDMAEGGMSRLFVLEAGMKYEQLSLSPVDQQLLETRKLTTELICQWFDVPPVLVHHSNVTAWGSGIEQLIQGFYTTAMRPTLINIEQAVRKRVMTPRQRVTMTVEFSLDALLRGNPKDRAEILAKLLQNAVISIAEARQLEGWPYKEGTDGLNIQSNLVPLAMLGQVKPASGGAGATIAQ